MKERSIVSYFDSSLGYLSVHFSSVYTVTRDRTGFSDIRRFEKNAEQSYVMHAGPKK